MASSRLEKIGTIFTRVEGLITRGGMRPDDRPLWFDVYKAFPPIMEPRFARPKPEIKPIRQILYKEDELRAKFHSKGHGLAAVNMLNPSGETQTKNLIKEYENQKALGVPEEEILDKCAETVISERKSKAEAARLTSNVDPQSITGQVLAEADIKNIFKEK
ncbi:hypothetical protein JYU34_012790 [Plutella xylostella]|uniref:Small ribosomal subunit protein mS23 n=1 Tax=Plutella xylostella TaxID=51655 RepID=A0ABQ7QFS1_PLUXY|nr:hypothetical protein JYU34_012790 [Plutella xylostella]